MQDTLRANPGLDTVEALWIFAGVEGINELSSDHKQWQYTGKITAFANSVLAQPCRTQASIPFWH